MWWSRQTPEVKNKVKKFVKEGRFEFVGGGWSQHDEVCSHYEDQINNMIRGHEFLMTEFGITPKVAW